MLFRSVAALCAAMSMSAQEYAAVPATFGTDAVETAAGTELGSSASIVMRTAFDDSYKNVGLATGNYTKFVFGDVVFDAANGLQGNTNPKDIDGGSPSATLKAPATGAVIEFEAKADGYLYVFGKLSSNKNYTVFEEGTCVGYRLVMQTSDPVLEQLDFTIEGVGEYNEVVEEIKWPETYSPNYAGVDIKANGMGVIKFPVFANCKYLVNAVGSKISFGGYYFDTDGNTEVSLDGDEPMKTVLMKGADGGTGIYDSAVSKEVVSKTYITVSGVEISQPVSGVNIVKSVMSDGSIEYTKEVK